MTLESMPDSFIVHSGTEIIYADTTFCSFIEAESRDELIGTSLMDVVGSNYQTPLREQITEIENGETPVRGLALELDTFTDQSPEVIAVSSMIEWDGTHHVQTSVFPVAGRETRLEQALHSPALEDAPIGITVSDPSQPDNPLVYVNDGFCEQTGYDREEILGRNCRFLQDESTRKEPVAKMREAIDAEESVAVELRNYRKDGSMFWNLVTIIPIRSESGTVTHWLGYQQDISKKKRYEQDLSLFKKQAEEANKTIFITDPEGTIQYVNPAFEELTGYTAEEAIGRNPRILNSDQQDEDFYAELWETITAGEIWEAELTNQTKYGELFEIEQKIIPVTDTQGDISHFVGIEQDITGKVLTTQQLNVLNRVLRHNLRNALTAIEGHAELLEDGELDDEARDASIKMILEQAASMRETAEQTADLRLIEGRSKSDQIEEQLDMQALVETYQNKYFDAQITQTIDGEATIQVWNANLVKKVLDEAVKNAIKHNDQSPPEVVITVRRESDVNQVEITVADNGPGIPELDQKAIKEGKETQLSHSLGMGLWLMEWVITISGGKLTISENEPRGTRLTFQIPVSSSDVPDEE